MAKSEREFYLALQEAIGDRSAIAVSVRLADVINCHAKHGPMVMAMSLR